MALTKSVAAVDEWAEVAQNAVREGTIVDVSGCYSALLHIFCCLSTTTAHTGTEIIVQVSSNTSGDEDWTTLAHFVGPVGTAISAVLANQEAAGQTVLGLTNPVTNNFDNDGKLKFIEHTTVGNSEVVFQVSNQGDAGDTITILDGLTNQQETTSTVFDIDHATNEAVGSYTVEIPFAANRVRVIYDNTYDPDGSTVHTNCRISKVTAI
ncbi:MAG: hypothetical protein ACXABY_25340 [Candidatus Thorarchaeota archaeon]|jgi:hypothetical protein